MLVLSRKENECIKLGDSITVTVVRVSGDKVRLGIEAPANILVLRGELEQEPLKQSRADARPAADAAAVLIAGCSAAAVAPLAT